MCSYVANYCLMRKTTSILIWNYNIAMSENFYPVQILYHLWSPWQSFLWNHCWYYKRLEGLSSSHRCWLLEMGDPAEIVFVDWPESYWRISQCNGGKSYCGMFSKTMLNCCIFCLSYTSRIWNNLIHNHTQHLYWSDLSLVKEIDITLSHHHLFMLPLIASTWGVKWFEQVLYHLCCCYKQFSHSGWILVGETLPSYLVI